PLQIRSERQSLCSGRHNHHHWTKSSLQAEMDKQGYNLLRCAFCSFTEASRGSTGILRRTLRPITSIRWPPSERHTARRLSRMKPARSSGCHMRCPSCPLRLFIVTCGGGKLPFAGLTKSTMSQQLSSAKGSYRISFAPIPDGARLSCSRTCFRIVHCLD